ncbi:hypothetical protein SCOR_30305 [Sulfidibacter corallicola]|uniref:DUF11 domain-containing protein n=1 Tax=Sulfidibacter corallicola TaxID=2818388 RepID=A0A8A4TJE5_SULCO|nr:DUF11 domain-containing protein [Sulfidibacter corallicola]QTD50149.1 hypothetical protein J3U87_31580 [Sulfidibacter corallicola]
MPTSPAASLVLAVFRLLASALLCTTTVVFAQTTGGDDDAYLSSSQSQEVRRVCPNEPNILCMDPFSPTYVVLKGCVTGGPSGFPAFTANVPPGQPLVFNVLGGSESTFRTFAIVSEAVANGNGVNPCVGGPGVFVGPIPIDFTDSPSPTLYTVPSADVDQIKAAVDADGFVVMLAMDCINGPQSFAGLGITRDPAASSTDLSLDLTSAPQSGFIGEAFDVEILLTNNGDENAESPIVSFDLPLGTDLVSAVLDGQDCVQTGNRVNCNGSDLGPAQNHSGFFRFEPQIGGVLNLDLSATANICDADTANNDLDITVPFLCPPDLDCFFGFGQNGNGTQSQIWVSNPNPLLDATVTIFTTDPNGSPVGTHLEDPGFIQATVPSGGRFAVNTNGTPAEEDNILWWLTSDNPDLQGEIRNFQESDGPNPKFLGSTNRLFPESSVDDFDTDYPIPFFDIVDGANQTVHLVNLTPTPQSTTGSFRDISTGIVSTTITPTLQPFEIQTFPLDQLGLPGTDPQGFWKSGEGPIVTIFEFDSPDTYQLFTPILPPDPIDGPISQPVFRPDPEDPEYDPSELELFKYNPTGDAVPGTTVTFEFDNTECGPGTNQTNDFPLTGGEPFTPIFLPIDIDDQLGGFGDAPLPPPTVSTVRWKEGTSEIWITAKQPSQNALVHIPKPSGSGTGQPAQVRLMIRSEADRRVPTASFNEDGNLLDFRFLDVPQGSHLYCLDDVTQDDELDFLEFQVPPGGSGDVWFNAIADEPDLQYKDQLPLHVLEDGQSRVGEFTKVLEAWNGNGGTSCLGDAPDILDIVKFMNDGLKCP